MLSNIVEAIVVAVVATTVETDASSPSAFKHETKVPLAASNLDRGFVVEGLGTNDIDYENNEGETRRQVSGVIRLSYINEHRGDTAAGILMLEDAQRIQKYVWRSFHGIAPVEGVDNFRMVGAATVVDSGESTRKFVIIPWLCDYNDTLS